MFRSRAGDREILESAVALQEEADNPAISDLLDDDDNDGNEKFVSPDPQRHCHNVHWLQDELGENCNGPSRYVAYYDAASLYPSSGK